MCTAMDSDEVFVSFSDTVFGFWEDLQEPPENSTNSGKLLGDDDEKLCSVGNEYKAFWEKQYLLLQATLCGSSSIETRVRQATKEVLTELNMWDMQCLCRREVNVKSCRNCLRREICDRLLNLGYNSALCTSKWRTSSEIQISGEHTYLEVKDNSNTKREVKVVIELSFRAEFEMARASEEYNKLMNRLPEVFVGKAERLQVIINIMCSAAKKCMKEKKMHLGPWRKLRYMQAKWRGMTDRNIIVPLPTVYSSRPRKYKASMLTCDLVENRLHCVVLC
ncbi:uncharacterized protein HKW66_Vig0218980 [Vigna angularis]|uniref:Uncharacterized protein n=3 Tax=Phaseolus angularis TaxID=3914 RepID=A0A8T0JGS0_PHAAN|nr:uncharacterized protein LOC108333648 [Vigna angularis]KAG2371724.1 uncharacterized protein HKW66_Vig0218980 [Vigna angularis]BAT92293.1 hypothetical protein VIGAN_07098500 [Vigna angularis var. angularis]